MSTGQAFDGLWRKAPLMMWQWCGIREPFKFQTSGNEMHLYFATDGSVTRSGFELTYRSKDGGYEE